MRRLATAAVAATIAAVPVATIFYPALAEAAAAGIAAPSATEAVTYSYRWWDYLTPSVIPRAIGGWELAAALAAAVFVARRDPRLRFWLWGTGILLVLALGPTLKFTGLPLAFALFTVWPPFEQFRTPARPTIPAIIGSTAIAAMVMDSLLRRMRPQIVVVAVMSALALRIALAALQHPLRVQEFPGYDAYRQLAAADRAAAVIEVPFGIRSGLDQIGGGGEVLQYYQHVHRRPILNAMVARLPSHVFAYYRARPSLMLLAGEPVTAGDDELRRDFDEVLDLTGADVVLLHRDLMTSDLVARVERLLEANLRLSRVSVEESLVVYRAGPRP